jgi:hypothetical protein
MHLAPGYVLGALDPAEMAAVREHLESCGRPHAELREFGGVAASLGGSLQPVEPPARLRASVLAAVQAEMIAARSAAPATAAAEAAPVEAAPERAPVLTIVKQTRGVVSLASFRAIRVRRVGVWATRVAAAVAIVGLVGYAVALQGDLNHAHTALDNSNKVLNAMTEQQARSAVLASGNGSAGAGVAVLLSSGHVLMDLHGLAPVKADQVYMAWLSSDGGATTKAGILTVDDQGKGFLELDNPRPVSSLWLMVCIEPNASVTRPTGPVIASGTIWLFSSPTGTPAS